MNARQLSTNDLLSMRERIVGKDIESYMGNNIYRGPITAMAFSPQHLIFNLGWHAKFDAIGNDGWIAVRRKALKKSTAVQMILTLAEFTIKNLSEGQIRLTHKTGGYYHVIFTKHQNLDPSTVKHLVLK